MKKDTPPYVVRLRGVLYFKRRGWPTLRFQHQDLGTAFHLEYARIRNGTAPQPKAFIVKGLISSYYRSQKFESLAPRTQADYRKYLMRFEKNAGDIEVKSIRRKHVIAWRDQLAKSDSPHYANYFVRVLRILFAYAGDIDELPVSENPAKGVSAVKYQRQKPKPWPQELIDAARAARGYDDKTRLLFELLYCTGQRIGDVLAMKWADIRGDAIDVSQRKTGAELVIPITGELQECLRRADRRGATILTANSKATPWAYRGAADAMMKLRKEIGAEAHNIHAIRHTVASEIGASGDDADVMSITGHTTSAMVRHYAGAARQKARAEKAQKGRK
jgi:integrase